MPELHPDVGNFEEISAPHHHSWFFRGLRRWTRLIHTYLSMLALILLLFFAMTGFMLNHEEWFGLDGVHSTTAEFSVPKAILESRDKLVLVEYLRSHCGVTGEVQMFDLTELPEPVRVSFRSTLTQCDADISADGNVVVTTDRYGLAGVMANLHKGKAAGWMWRRVLDATAILLFVISLSGLLLWASLPGRRVWGVAALVVSALVVYLAWVP